MTASAEDWGAHDLDRRFDLGPARDELTGLAATLDHLLARIAASRRHEQRFASEMAHELRTPLAGLRARAELALGGPGTEPGTEAGDALRAIVESRDAQSHHRRAAPARTPGARPGDGSRRPRGHRVGVRRRRGHRAAVACRRPRASPTSCARARPARRQRTPPRALAGRDRAVLRDGRSARRSATTGPASSRSSAIASSSQACAASRAQRVCRTRAAARASAGTLVRRRRRPRRGAGRLLPPHACPRSVRTSRPRRRSGSRKVGIAHPEPP